MHQQAALGAQGLYPVGGAGNLLPLPNPAPGALERVLRRVPGVAGLLDAIDKRALEAAAFDNYLENLAHA